MRPVPSDRDQQAGRRRLVTVVAAGLLGLVGVTVPLIVVLVSRTSSASFADAEVLSANRLGAAVLDIEVQATADASGRTGGRVEEVQALFSAVNLAPGDAISGQLEMVNRGDIALRYGLSAVGDGSPLGRWLRFEVWAANGICSPGQAGQRVIEDVQLGSAPATLVEMFRADGANVLEPGESFSWCLGATLPLDTPNEAQGQRLDLTLVVSAEQLAEDGS